jgi:hypothetical protein
MCTDKPNEDHSVRILDQNHHTVTVAPNVEYHAVVSYKAGVAIDRFNIRRAVPVGVSDIVIPRLQWLTSVWMFIPECHQRASTYDMHSKIISQSYQNGNYKNKI